ncbi:MAG: 3'(2'),5'-bisphosphate nucleotidase CysQ [Rikenellaceae bacterium]
MRVELSKAIEAAITAGDRIMEIYNDPESDFEIERKADNSPLTIADRGAHMEIVEILAPLGIPILSEEGRSIPYAERAEWQRLWVVDPLDGTKEFIKRNGEFTVNIALVEDGDPVLGVIYVPATGELYYGDRGVGAFKAASPCTKAERLPLKESRASFVVVASRSHLSPETEEFIAKCRATHDSVEMVSKGSSLKISLVAEGEADVYPRYAPTMEWDTAAGDALLRAMGMSLIDTTTLEPLRYNKEDLLNPFFVTSR